MGQVNHFEITTMLCEICRRKSLGICIWIQKTKVNVPTAWINIQFWSDHTPFRLSDPPNEMLNFVENYLDLLTHFSSAFYSI